MAGYTHSRPLRLFEICAGYGSQALALERLRRDYPDFCFELAGWCECDPESSKSIDEQPAVIAHNALHPDGIGKNWGDLTKIDWEQVPDFDLLTASTPCQSISSAGLQHGFVKDSGTRSSIIWNVHDCVRVKRPRYILMENVSAILSDKFFPLLHLWMVELEHMGYTNFMPTPFTLQDGSTTRNGCLNSKHYGCPQNRERWFMVSILDCKEAYYFPKPFKLERRLKDVLEKSVPESLYLTEKGTRYIMGRENFKPNLFTKNSEDVSATLCCGDHSYRKTDNFVIEPCIAAMRGRSDGEWYGSEHQQRLEIGGSDTSNSLTSVAKDNLLLEPAILSQRRTEEGKKIRRQHKGDVGIPYSHKELVPREDGISNTLSTVEKDNYLIEPCVSCIGNIYDNDANPQAGRIYDTDGISPTLDTCCGGNREPKILEPVVIEDFYQDRPIRVYEGEAPTLRSDRAGLKVAEPIVLGWVRDTKGNVVSRPEVDVANCVTAGKRDNTQNYVLEQVIEEVRKAFPNRGILMYKGNPYFVRKLSTRELYRLMDLEENDIDTLMATDISKTSHSKLAGNSIVVSVLYHIFRTMFIDTVPIAGTQTTLF